MGDFETLNVMLSNIQQQLVNPFTGFDEIQIQPNSILLKLCGYMIIQINRFKGSKNCSDDNGKGKLFFLKRIICVKRDRKYLFTVK